MEEKALEAREGSYDHFGKWRCENGTRAAGDFTKGRDKDTGHATGKVGPEEGKSRVVEQVFQFLKNAKSSFGSMILTST